MRHSAMVAGYLIDVLKSWTSNEGGLRQRYVLRHIYKQFILFCCCLYGTFSAFYLRCCMCRNSGCFLTEQDKQDRQNHHACVQG